MLEVCSLSKPNWTSYLVLINSLGPGLVLRCYSDHSFLLRLQTQESLPEWMLPTPGVSCSKKEKEGKLVDLSSLGGCELERLWIAADSASTSTGASV